MEIVLLALALAADAFAVSVCKGLAQKDVEPKHMLICGAYFGGFQALMPIVGFFLGSAFYKLISAVDHWIAFALLAIIGIIMIVSSREEKKENASFKPSSMLPLAVATSIDALAVGISLSLVQADIWAAIAVIGIITFITSAAGVKIGSVFGTKLKSKAEIAGGVLLIGLGVKILLEHLGVFG
ncbi:MAG: manganese efflux pump [Clostridia bacterium]|nr:manganese efflux pump [Clostridia bacterium]